MSDDAATADLRRELEEERRACTRAVRDAGYYQRQLAERDRVIEELRAEYGRTYQQLKPLNFTVPELIAAYRYASDELSDRVRAVEERDRLLTASRDQRIEAERRLAAAERELAALWKIEDWQRSVAGYSAVPSEIGDALDLVDGLRAARLAEEATAMKRAWICKIAFDHEVEGNAKGTTFYPTEESLRSARKCAEHPGGGCDVVEVEIRVFRIIPGDGT